MGGVCALNYRVQLPSSRDDGVVVWTTMYALGIYLKSFSSKLNSIEEAVFIATSWH